MARKTHREKLIDEELEAHIADAVLDLISQGMEKRQADEVARQQFGNIIDIKKQTVEQYSDSIWNRFGPTVCIIGPYAVLSVVFLLMWLVMRRSLIGVTLEPFFLWWVFAGVIAMTLLIVKWIFEYTGLLKIQGVVASMIFVLLEAFSLTNVLDINDFEVNIHAVLLAAVLFLVLQLAWKRLSALIKTMAVYGFTVVVTWSALVQEPLFGFIGTARCLYIKSSEGALPEVVAMCSQVPFMSRLLIPIYILLAVGVPFMIYFLFRYWISQSTVIWRKVIFSCVVAALPLAPAFVNDVNTLGGLDVIPWKAEIYQAYWETIGRRPEEKDFDFYARTRAYENIEQVKTVLFASQERRLKIRLIYQEVLGRAPSKEEIGFYIENQRTIDGIYEDLQKQIE